MRLRERARLSAALTRCALIRYRCKLGLDLSNPVGLRHDGNNQNASRRPAHFAWPTHPQAATREVTSFSYPRSSFARKCGTGSLVPVVGQRPARVLRQSRRARSFLGNIRAIFGLRGQGKCVRTSMDHTLCRHGRDGAGTPVWAAFGSAGLLFLFGSAMAISFGIKSPLDYSVFAAMCCALFLGLAGSNRWTVDSLL